MITAQSLEVERMYTDFYGLSFNPFDKQMVKEKDAFESEDFREMTARLHYWFLYYLLLSLWDI